MWKRLWRGHRAFRALICLTPGLALGALTALVISFSQVPETWLPAEAEVLSSELVDRSHPTRRRSKSYGLMIALSYEVKGEPWETTVATEWSMGPGARLDRMRARYAAGTVHPVRVRPQSPEVVRFDAQEAHLTGPVMVLGITALVALLVGGVWSWLLWSRP